MKFGKKVRRPEEEISDDLNVYSFEEIETEIETKSMKRPSFNLALHASASAYLSSTLDLLAKINTYFISLKVTNYEARFIEENTRGQSSNQKWMEARIGRLTASIFKSVCTLQEKHPQTILLKL